jgi:hypothetical protein
MSCSLLPPSPRYTYVLHCTFQLKFEFLISSFSPISTLVTICTIGFDIKKSSTCGPQSVFFVVWYVIMQLGVYVYILVSDYGACGIYFIS